MKLYIIYYAASSAIILASRAAFDEDESFWTASCFADSSWNALISGKINHFKKRYQIVNPSYVVPVDKEDYVNKIIPRYSLTEGLNEKIYRN